jgi:hypothetical protein
MSVSQKFCCHVSASQVFSSVRVKFLHPQNQPARALLWRFLLPKKPQTIGDYFMKKHILTTEATKTVSQTIGG